MDRDEVRQVVREVLEQLQTNVSMADKWEGGTLILKPGLSSLQSKEIPIETFFHKVVMVRDKLRVLEQKINTNAKISDVEKAEMQQYITRCYGSLTTLNVLFKHEEDKFKGSSGD